jgi:hypothetical protein
MATKTKRLEIRAEEIFIRKLEELATASGTSKAEVIDRAVGLYAHALEEAQKGNDLFFAPAKETSQQPKPLAA